MPGIQDIGNGYGYLYMTEVDGTTIRASQPNTKTGAKFMRSAGIIVAPFAAKRSAIGYFIITGVPGTGNITGISVNGSDQIGSGFTVTGLTPEQAAQLAAAAINAFSPGSGFDFTAIAIGPKVLIIAPPSAGSSVNGYAIALTDSGGPVITWTSVPLGNGGDESGVYDSLLGNRFFLNADYGPSGVSGETPASPTSLTGSVEISKYMIDRGQQVGVFNVDATVSLYALTNLDRSGIITKLNVAPGSGITDTVVVIDPTDFVDGDQIFIQSNDPANTITLESAPTTSITGLTPNIYLTDDVSWVSNRYSSIVLQFKYLDGIGPCFVELSRSLAKIPQVLIGQTLYVSKLGDDAIAILYNAGFHYKTITAARTAATAGDTIVVFPGIYDESQLQKDGVNYYFMPGASINTTSNIFQLTTETMVVDGFGDFVASSGTVVSLNGACNFTMRCKSMQGAIGISIAGAAISNIEVFNSVTSAFRCVNVNGTGVHFIKIKKLILTAAPLSFSFSTSVHLRCFLFSGTLYLESEEMSQTVGGSASIYIDSITSTGSVTFKCPKIINRFTTFVTTTIALANAINYFKFIGNVYCDGVSSKANAILSVVPSQSVQYVLLDTGEIRTEDGYAYCSTAGRVNCQMSGDIYCKTANIADPDFPIPAAIQLGGEGPFPGSQSTFYFKRGSINQFKTGSVCIYKRMQSTGGLQIDNICKLQNTQLYSSDTGFDSIEGDAPVGPAINSIIISDVISNLAVDANITVNGGTMIIEPLLVSTFPPSIF